MTKKLDKLMTMDPKEITFEMVHKKLMEIVSTRGRRGTDRQEQVSSVPVPACACDCTQELQEVGRLLLGLALA